MSETVDILFFGAHADDVEVRPLGGSAGCLGMILFSVLASVVLTLLLKVPVSLGVGGSFDVYSEKLKRAPQYIQRSGMEWLYRVWQEPWRWKRMSYVPRFMLFALREWIFGSSPSRKANDAKPTNTAP